MPGRIEWNIMLRTVIVLTLYAGACFGGSDIPILYKSSAAPRPTPDRFVTPTVEEPPILNPPGFRWNEDPAAASYDLELSRERGFKAASTISYRDLRLNLFTPERALEPGVWFWRTRSGKSGVWSAIREFRITTGLPSIPTPPLSDLLARLQRMGYPRIFLSRENLPKWRSAIRGPRAADWRRFTATLPDARKVDMTDPPVLEGERRTSAANNKVFLQAVTRAVEASEAVQSLALNFLLTDNREDGQRARQILLALASWRTYGSTDRATNDTAFRAVVRGLAIGYDWLRGADLLSEADRRAVERAIAVRGKQYADWYRRAGVHSQWPYPSHTFGGLPYYGEIGVAFAGVLPEAEDWLRLWVYAMTANYPSFGRSDGSWSEGGRYWHNSMERQLFPVWGLGDALGLNLPAHPFFASTGYFKIYANPPWDKMTVFGDAHNQAVGGGDAKVMLALATLLGNPDYAWYGQAVRRDETGEGPKSMSAADFFTMDFEVIKQIAGNNQIASLPLARAFPDTGLVAMRTNLTDPHSDIEFLLRANPFGSVSHAHADQGNFYLAAYGEPLLIPSGHYQGGHEVLFGSPHHSGWTWQSLAHNVPLIDGKGQAPRSPAANAYLEHFYHSGQADLARVDLTRAYQAEAAEPKGGLPVPAGSAPITSYRRTVLFLRPGTFVLIDDIECSREARLDWRLHAWNSFAIDNARQQAKVSNGGAGALIQWIAGAPAKISQTNEFSVPLSDAYKKQWHLNAAYAARRLHRVFTVISPYKTGSPETPPEVSATEAGLGLRWKDERACSVSLAQADKKILRQGAIEAAASLLASCQDWTYAADATTFKSGGQTLSFSVPVDVIAKAGTLEISSSAAFEISGRGRYPAGNTSLKTGP